MVKNLKICRIVDSDSSKKGFYFTVRNVKNLSSLQCTVSEKIKKNCQKWSALKKCAFFAVILEFFRSGTLQGAAVFCVSYGAPRSFF